MKKLKRKRPAQAAVAAETVEAPAVDGVHSTPAADAPVAAAKAAGSAPAPLSSGWWLAVRSWRDYRAHWWFYVMIVATVMLPINLLGLIGDLGDDASFQSYATVATVFMNVALIYAMVQVAAGRGLPGLRTAYYNGSAAALRSLLVSFALAIVALPMTVGFIVLLLGLAPAANSTATVGERVLISALGGLLIVPSLWWLVRFAFSLIVVVAEGARPIQAMRRSRKATLGRFWPVAARLVIMLLLLGLIAAALFVPVGLLGMAAKGQEKALVTAYQLSISLVLLPLGNLYLFKLYRDLIKLPAKG